MNRLSIEQYNNLVETKKIVQVMRTNPRHSQVRESAATPSQKVDRSVTPKTDYKARLLSQFAAVGIEVEPEFKIFADRRFRADWRIVDTRILIEFEGGLFHKSKMGHSSVTGILRDMEKANLCALAGWIVIRVAPNHVVSGQALLWIEHALFGRVN